MAVNSLSALSLASYMFLPAKVAKYWFGTNEKVTAIGIEIGFDMLSVGVGFLHSTLLIHNGNDKAKIRSSLKGTFDINSLLLEFHLLLCLSKVNLKTPPSDEAEENVDNNNKIRKKWHNNNNNNNHLFRFHEIYMVIIRNYMIKIKI